MLLVFKLFYKNNLVVGMFGMNGFKVDTVLNSILSLYEILLNLQWFNFSRPETIRFVLSRTF